MLFANRNLLFFFRNIIESDKDTERERQGWGGGELKEIKRRKEGMGKEKKRKKEGGRRKGGGREREKKKRALNLVCHEINSLAYHCGSLCLLTAYRFSFWLLMPVLQLWDSQARLTSSCCCLLGYSFSDTPILSQRSGRMTVSSGQNTLANFLPTQGDPSLDCRSALIWNLNIFSLALSRLKVSISLWWSHFITVSFIHGLPPQDHSILWYIWWNSYFP